MILNQITESCCLKNKNRFRPQACGKISKFVSKVEEWGQKLISKWLSNLNYDILLCRLLIVNDFPKILYHYEFSCLNPGIT
jgi:hypothetical protein